MNRDESEVLRSGGWHVVRRGELARVVRPDGHASKPMLFGSVLAHVHVADPWEAVADLATLPPAVAAVVADPAPWQKPEWL